MLILILNMVKMNMMPLQALYLNHIVIYSFFIQSGLGHQMKMAISVAQKLNLELIIDKNMMRITQKEQMEGEDAPFFVDERPAHSQEQMRLKLIIRTLKPSHVIFRNVVK